MKRRIALITDLFLFCGWTAVGLLNMIFFAVHASPANVAGILGGEASASFTFMTLSAFALLSASALVAYLSARKKALLAKIRGSAAWRAARIVLAGFALFFIAVLAAMVAASFPGAASEAPEMLILGAHVSDRGLSQTLQSRLDAGAAYAAANPGVKIIVSGGQGLDEPVTEASAMRDYLVSLGIARDRIALEENSHNTFENLLFTRDLLGAGPETYPIIIVTSEFHIRRTRMLAARAGFEPRFIAAKTPLGILPSCYSREFFGLLKSYFADRL